jgi:hypothetical protein
VVEGERLLRAHPAPLPVLPVFVRVGSSAEQVAGAAGKR